MGKLNKLNKPFPNFRGSVFLANLHYAYGQTDGTYKFPNSLEGDLLRQAHKEILLLLDKKPKSPKE